MGRDLSMSMLVDKKEVMYMCKCRDTGSKRCREIFSCFDAFSGGKDLCKVTTKANRRAVRTAIATMVDPEDFVAPGRFVL